MRAFGPLPFARADQDFAVPLAFGAMKLVNRHRQRITNRAKSSSPERRLSQPERPRLDEVITQTPPERRVSDQRRFADGRSGASRRLPVVKAWQGLRARIVPVCKIARSSVAPRKTQILAPGRMRDLHAKGVKIAQVADDGSTSFGHFPREIASAYRMLLSTPLPYVRAPGKGGSFACAHGIAGVQRDAQGSSARPFSELETRH